MPSFEPGFIAAQPISQGLLQTIRQLGEFKGQQDLFARQAPQVLELLRQTAVIQSTESSNRIEGVVAPAARIKQLVEQQTTPRNRSEQEIAGYRDVLNTIHVNHPAMPVSANLVRQLHRDLFQFTPSPGGDWKPTDNAITETHPDGTVVVRFQPVPAHLTGEAMARLHDRYRAERDAGEVEPLLLIASYVLDFLCIHPFRDGNGRLARLLTLLLLYQAGYQVGRYISLEQVIERTKESYYDTLHAASQGWHDRAHNPTPWWDYFLGTLVAAYREFEDRVGLLRAAPGAKSEMVREAIRRLPEEFRFADIERACPGVSRPTIDRVLARLREQGAIRCVRSGRDALWRKSGS